MRRLTFGMIGGGPGAFIGPVHRLAAELDGRLTLAAGAFSSDAGRSREAAAGYGIDRERAYPDYQSMFAGERRRDDPIDFVAIVTPNALHLPMARAALAAGFPVISDKPATATLAEALALRDAVIASGLPYALTHTYTGYPMVRQARQMCAQGALGNIRKVVVEYAQGWLAQPAAPADKQAAWRGDPARAGIGGCVSDIGTHAFNIAEFVTGRTVSEVCAMLTAVVAGRALDDDCNILLRFDNGAVGVLVASQIATGERNALRLRVYGDQAGLDWSHEDANVLTINKADGRTEILHAGWDGLGVEARAASRLPSGHPEGYIEAFANLYRDFADIIAGSTAAGDSLLPSIADGVRGMAFIEASVASSRAGSRWTEIGGLA